MTPNRINRPEARVLAEEEFRRFADLVASLTPEEWATPDRLHGVGRPQDGAARARIGRRAGVGPGVRRTSCAAGCRSTRRSTRTTGSTA